jgi:hypothetical protein
MADWEASIQLPDGGIQGGIYGSQPVQSSSFATGQVLFGLVAAHHEFGDPHIHTAAIRAGDWLLSCLDSSGKFVRGDSNFCAPGPKTYEIRTAAALAELADIGRQEYRTAASRIADYTLSMQRTNGWFAQNDLNCHEAPLTHTIGYVLEGLYDIGIRLGRQDCLDASERTLNAIVPLIGPDGRLPGRLRADWSSTVDWVCLTGSSQIAGVFVRMYRRTRNPVYLAAGEALLGFVAFTQQLQPGASGIDGGIRGSYPFGGEYGRWCVLNWATKFFADSVMDFLEIEEPCDTRR